eukprot:Protomagalhaensia_sp_Gyna_25__3467@NODE_311_length_3957_cov_8_535988_g242_i0_p1_GENE_NODE_311_length_3957_cov_8_535988_g242_i0NODE_311_length_3957_cov_8_535988_g242_i0_p1_ORF_typecomplete_len530_score68_89Exostosin/PF03016_15/1_2e13_NODE_311_length_3957_cov_8_535988_g242_i022593848
MRWFCLASVAVAEHTPREYPIDPSILKPCQQAGFQHRPASLLCRPRPTFSPDIEEYIKGLEIKDADFYDVFTEAEIVDLFKPRRTEPIPFYLWDDFATLHEVSVNVWSDQGDQWASLYEDFKIHPWRTHHREEALVHFVALPYLLLIHTPEGFGEFRKKEANEYAETVIASPEWRQFNGSNFFVFSGQDSPMIRALGKSNGVFKALQEGHPLPGVKEGVWHILQQANMFHCTNSMDLRPCFEQTNYSAKEKFRSLRRWPGGTLESYKQPLGAFHALQKERQHHYFFMGQADTRAAYRTRAHAVKSLAGFWEPSVAARSGNGEPLPQCTTQNLTGCEMNPKLARSAMTFERWMMDSQYGLHLRGDTYYSGRLAEIHASGVIPIIVDHTIYDLGLSGKCHQPAKDMAIWISEAAWFEDARGEMESKVINRSWTDQERILRLLEYYRPDNVHGMLTSRVPEDRVKDIIASCLPAEVSARTGFQKIDIALCPFDPHEPMSSFVATIDEDDTPVWGCSWHDPQKKSFCGSNLST